MKTGLMALTGNQHQQFKQLLIHLSEFLHDHAQYTDIHQMDILQRKNLVELWLKLIDDAKFCQYLLPTLQDIRFIMVTG